MSEQETLITTVIPEPIFLTLQGERFEIKEIKVGKLAKVMQIVAPYYEQIRAFKKAQAKIMAEKAKANLENGTDEPVSVDLSGVNFYTMVVENLDSVFALLEVLTEKDRAWLENLGLDELVSLLSSVVEVNLDFFIQKLLPLLLTALDSVSAPIAGVAKARVGLTGQMQSIASSAKATDTPTS